MVLIPPILFCGPGAATARPASHLERQTGELTAEAAGDQRPQDAGHQTVAAVFGGVETLVGGAPRAVATLDTLRLAENIIPHHLLKCDVKSWVTSIKYSNTCLNVTLDVRSTA